MQVNKPDNIKYIKLGLIFFIFSAVFLNIVFFSVDNSIKGIDSANHLSFSLEFYQQLNNIFADRSLPVFAKAYEIKKLFSEPVAYGGIYWLNGLNAIASFFYSIKGVSLFSAKLSLCPFLIILLLATYYIGEYCYDSATGLMASLVLFLYPIVFQSSRQFQLDFPLAALIALGMFFLLKSEFFESRKYSICAGSAFGAAMLIKGQALIFMIGPMLFMIIKICRSIYVEKKQKKHVLLNILLFLSFTTVFSYLWWGGKDQLIFKSLKEHVFSSTKSSFENFA